MLIDLNEFRPYIASDGIEGADFIDVYNYFIKEGVSMDQAFENSRRVSEEVS